MAYNYLASQVPIPTAIPAAPTQSGCTGLATTANMPNFSTSMTAGTALLLNQTLAQIATAIDYGGNGQAIADGLTISAGTGLLLNITAGHAAISGFPEYDGGTQVVTNNTAHIFVWYLPGGTTTTTTTTTPPTSNSVFIGSCTTSGGIVTSVDLSGVCYIVGGLMVRYTSNPGMPDDSPHSSPIFLTKCPSGDWLWDGSKYLLIGDIISVNKTTLVSGDNAYVPAGYQAQNYGIFTITGGTLTVLGTFRITA